MSDLSNVGETPAISDSLIISPSNLQSTETPTLSSDACLQTNTKVGTTYVVNDKDDSPLQTSLPSLSPKRERTMSSPVSTLSYIQDHLKVFRDAVNKVQTWKHESQNSQEDIKKEEEEKKEEEQEKPQNDQKVLYT